MVAHDTGGLWGYASAELDGSEVAVLEEHLSSCPECREELDFIRASRLALRTSAHAEPLVDWDEVDERVGDAVSRRMTKPWLSGWLRPALAAAIAAPVAIAVVAALGYLKVPTAAPAPVAAAVPAPVLERARASLATGTMVRAAEGERALQPGEALASGDRLRTAARGLALLELPDRSQVRLGPSSELAVVQVSRDEIGLKLGKGRLAARAEHSPARPFVVDAGGVLVRVVGTAFTVSSNSAEVEVSVGEGTVLIEPEQGQSLLLNAGQRVRFERAGWKARQGAISAAQRAELGELGVKVASRSVPVPVAVPVPVPVNDLPVVVPVPPVAPEPVPTAVEEWQPFSPAAPVSATEASAPPMEPAAEGLPRDVEGLFLRRAEEGLIAGKCSAYELGLGELLESSESPQAREKARILRARCYDATLRPADAEREYRKYLDEYPAGRWSDEARGASEDRGEGG